MNFFKGIMVGIGGIAPGLSGSVMLLILGLYEKTIGVISTLFKEFKKNCIFLMPLVLGFGCGVLIFSKVVDFLLKNYEFSTRYLFLGLVLGTVPLFYKSVKKKGFKNYNYVIILIAMFFGLFIFSMNRNLFQPVTNPSLFQSVLLGVAVAGSSIVPGVDSAVILSALGLYELYVNALANFNLQILIPAGIGLVIGVFLISIVINYFITHFYTITYSIIFGLFLSIIPNVLNNSCIISDFNSLLVAILFSILGFIFSYYLGDIKGNNEKISKFLK